MKYSKVMDRNLLILAALGIVAVGVFIIYICVSILKLSVKETIFILDSIAVLALSVGSALYYAKLENIKKRFLLVITSIITFILYTVSILLMLKLGFVSLENLYQPILQKTIINIIYLAIMGFILYKEVNFLKKKD